MAKDKDKKKKKKGKKGGKGGDSGSAAVTQRLKAISQNPLVADLVAATLVAAAAALRDTKRAHKLAANAENELRDLAKSGQKRGSELWQLALDVGQRSLEAMTGEDAAPKPRKARASKRRTAKPRKAPAAKARKAPAVRAAKRAPARKTAKKRTAAK